MATWQNVMTTMVRHLINDLGATQTFDDSRLQQAIVVAGIIVSQEYDFSTDYTFDVEAPDISPDPVAESDNTAIALMTLKAACLVNVNQYQSATKTGIKVRDGDSEVDTTSGFKGYSDILLHGPCAAYKALLESRAITDSMNAGQAIFSPYTDDNSATWGINGNWQVRGFFDSFLRY